MAASAYTDTVQKVYIAYYGRAADPVGLAYWSQAIDDAGGSLDAIMTSFGTSAEATTLYGSLSNSAKVNAIYQQSFGRDADFTGLMYYSGQLSAGTMTASSIAQNIFDGATGTDATTLTNKLAVAKAYTTAIDAADEVVAYAGTVAAASARTLLSTVDSTTTTSGFDVETSIAAMVTAANVVPKTAAEIAAAAKVISDAADAAAAKVITDAAKVVADAKVLADAATAQAILDAAAKVVADKVISDAAAALVTANAATTKELTTGVNKFTTNDGDDTFDGSTAGSLDTSDVLKGGAGDDSLNATFTATESLRPTLTNIENVSLTIDSGNTLTLDTRSATGVTKYTDESSAGSVTLNSIAAVTDVEVTSATGGTTTINYTDAAIAGSANTQNLTVNNITGTTNVTITDAGGTTNELETLAITSTSLASTITTLDTSGVETSKLSVSGDADLTITNALSAGILTLDAASATGDVSVSLASATAAVTATGGSGADTITAGAFVDTITGGAGDDTLKFATANLTTTDTVAGGTGTDTLSMTDASTVIDADFTNITSVETMTQTTASHNMDLTLGAASMASGLVTVTGGTGTDTVTVGAGHTSALTFDLVAGTNDVLASASAAVITVNLADNSLTSADTLTGGSGTTDTLVVTGGGTAVAAADVSGLSGFETIEAKAGADLGFTTADANAADGKTLHLDGSNLTSAYVFTASALLEQDAIVTITGGAGADILEGSVSDQLDTISGGAGNDTIKMTDAGLTSVDVVSGGAGADTLGMSDASTVIDADFTNITSVETVTQSDTNEAFTSLTLGALAQASGITTVTGNGTGSDTVVVGAGFTNALTMNLGTGTDSYTATNTAGAMTFATSQDGITTADTVTGGTSTSDVLLITGGGTAVASGDVDGVTKVETFQAKAGASVNIAIDELNAADEKTLHLDGANLTSAYTFTASAVDDTNGIITITGGAGGDTLTGSISDHGDNITGGAGNDTLSFTDAGLTSADTVSGGDGADTLSMVAASTVIDADFTNITSVETFTNTTNGHNITSLTLGALAQAAGITAVTGVTTGSDTVVVGSGFTNAITMTTGTGTDSYTSTASGAMTVKAGADSITSGDTLTGGTGSGDTLTITNENSTGLLAADMASVTGFETINFATNVLSTAFTTHDNMVASGGTMTLDGTALTTTVFTADLSAETDGSFTVTAGGTGAHIVTLGNKDDSYTSTSTGVDTVVATAGANTISTGTGNDIITGGTGADNIIGGVGDDTMQFTTGNLTSADTLTGGAGTDTLSLTTDGSTVVDADFTNATSIEVLGTTGTNRMTLATIGALADAAGLTTVNFSDTGTVDKLVVGSGFTSALTVDMDIDTASNTIDATAYTGTLTVTASTTDLDTAAHSLTGGTGTADVIEITTAGSTQIASADLANVTAFEKITTVGYAAGLDIILNDGNIGAGKTLTIDATSFDDDVLTFSGVNETSGSIVITADGTGDHQIILGNGADTYTSTSSAGEDVTATAGNNTISTGGGADIVIAGTDDDNVTLGTGNDTISFATANLTSGDTVNGGSGTDIVQMTNDATVVDSDFTNMTLVETLTGSGATVSLTATLGAEALEAGIVTATLTDTAAADKITVASGYTGTLTVNVDSDDINAGTNTITASGSAGTIIVAGDDTNLNKSGNETTITGGSGTSDEIKVTVTGGTMLLDNVTAVEKITTVLAAGDLTMVTVDANVASGKSLTVDATSMDGDVLNFDGSAELDGTFTITTDGTGAHIVTLGAKNDTYTGSSTGIDTIVATGGVNTISTGAGADIITSGTGVDTITGGAGADVFTYAKVTQSNSSNTDSITDWKSGTDKLSIKLDYNTSISATTIDAVIQTARAGVTLAQDNLSGARGQVIYDTTNSNLLVNVNNDNFISTSDYKISLNAASTAADTVVAGDINFTILGGSGADTITSGGGADTITTGGGGGTVIAGDGADTITFGGGTDTYKVLATTAAEIATEVGTTAGTDIDFVAGSDGDKLSTYVSATDKLHFDDALLTNAIGTEADTLVTLSTATGTVTNAARFVELTIAFNGTTGDAIADLNALTSTAVAIGDSFLAFLNDGTDGFLFLVEQVSASNTIAAQDVTLVGQIAGVTNVANGDFVTF